MLQFKNANIIVQRGEILREVFSYFDYWSQWLHGRRRINWSACNRSSTEYPCG